MKLPESHLTDEQLLLGIDGELPEHDRKLVRAHLDACWICRARRQELENGITDFVGVYRNSRDEEMPPVAGPRALLKARLAEAANSEFTRPSNLFVLGFSVALAAALCVVLVVASLRAQYAGSRASLVVSVPDSTLTPGATLLVSRRAVCSEAKTNNKAVPVAVRRKVFEEYRIADADPGAYEVDYLVTPALGGADDLHNLWPHSYSATVWNARVKDALEDRLREMVCDGSLDLSEAQREIAGDWIAAYKKYFHTDRPLAEHCRDCIQ